MNPQEKSQEILRLRKRKIKDSVLYLIKMAPLMALASLLVSVIGNFYLQSYTFITLCGLFNGLFFASVFMKADVDRYKKFQEDVKKVLSQ